MNKRRIITKEIAAASCGMDTFSCSQGMLSAATQHIVGITPADNAEFASNRMYVNFSLPTTTVNHRIQKVELVVFQQSAVCEVNGNPKIGLYCAEEAATADAAEGDFSSVLTDYVCMGIPSEEEDDVRTYAFDITRMIDEEDNAVSSMHTVVIKLMDESLSCNCNAVFYGASDNDYAPVLRITYAINYGVSISGHTHKLGRFGQGSVDLATGNLMLEFEDFNRDGSRMPISLKHQYTSALGGFQYTYNNGICLPTAYYDMLMVGKGWRLNVMQSMMRTTFTLDGNSYIGYVYMDENSDEVYFTQNSDGSYEDISGSGMMYNASSRKLTQGDCVYEFCPTGWLRSITDQHGNSMTLTYSGNQLAQITDGAGREYNLIYNGVYLVGITAPSHASSAESTQTIQFTNSGGMLTKVTYPDGRYVSITPNSVGKPLFVRCYDSDGNCTSKVQYTYSGNKIQKIQEYGIMNGVEVPGHCSEFVYTVSSSKTTVEATECTDNEDGTVDTKTVTTVYTFDDDGEIVSEYVYSNEIAKAGGSANENGISAEDYTNNLLANAVFQNSSNWEMTLLGETTFTCDRTTDNQNALYHGNVLQMVSEDEGHANAGLYQSITVAAGQYTFSAYLRTVTNITGNSNPGVYLRVVDLNGNTLAESTRISGLKSEYERLTVHFELSDAQEITVQILMDGAGTVYGCAPQLEANPCASAYNLLQNGDFRNEGQGWNYSTAMVDTANYFNAVGGLKIIGDVEEGRCAYQNVPAFADIGTRETFTLSGWAKADGLPVRDRGTDSVPTFRLKAVIQYNDDESTEEEYYANFTSRSNDWQQASVQFAKKEYKQVSSVKVYCDYSYNSGTAYFDNIQLVRDSLETGLTADDFVEAQNEEEEETTVGFEEVKDAYGNILTETIFDPDNPDCGTIYRSFAYGNSGNDLTQETDPRGNVTTYDVDAATSRINMVTDRCGNKTNYEYDISGRTTKVISKDTADIELAHVAYNYDTFDNLTGIVRGDGMGYALQYNAFHELEAIGVSGKDKQLVTYGYNSTHGRLKTVTYANGDTMKVAYNALGQLVSEKWYDATNALTASYRYVYDNQGTVIRSIDILNLKEYNYSYSEGRLLRAVECTITLDEYENVTSRTTVNEIRYNYDADGNLANKQVFAQSGPDYMVRSESADNLDTVAYGGFVTGPITCQTVTDALGRKASDAVAQVNRTRMSRQFSYCTGEVTATHTENGKQQSEATTRLVSQITFSDGRTIAYGYDEEERIISVTDSLNGTTEYIYDSLGQLLTETVNGTVVNAMTYDNYGNILTKNGKLYTYGNAAWKDLLTAYDGQSVTYDAQGNPTIYLGHTLTWEKGRQLKSFDNNTYTYNANGIRTSKTVNGVKHSYVLDGSKILQESFRYGSMVLTPVYDTEDSVCGIVFNNAPFFFMKNLQGDVIGIVNGSGTVVAQYTYDAWGNCTITQDTNGIATINPFRYRGYYFDAEIGMYYLRSRYYDPTVGRFINADDVSVLDIATKVLDYSLFSYCENNVVNNCDISGCLSWSSIALFFKRLLNGVKEIVDIVKKFISNQLSNYKTILGSWQDVSAIAKEIGRSPNKVKQSLNSIISKLQKTKARIGKIAIGITILSTIASLGEKIARLGNIAKIITECVMETMESVLKELLTKALKAVLKLIPAIGAILGLFANSVASAILDAVLKTSRLQAAQQKIQIAIEATTYSLKDYFVVFFKNLV